MPQEKFNHTAKHFFHRKAIIEYYDSSFILLDRKEYKIEKENRFLFHGLDLDQLYVSYHDEYEIIIFENFDFKEINGIYHYVSAQTGLPLSQSVIDKEIINKCNWFNADRIPKFLAYQLKKYPNKKERLKHWIKLIDDEGNFFDPVNSWYNRQAQHAAKEWVNSRIRKSNLRSYQPSRDILLDEIFESPDLLQSVITKLTEHGFTDYNSFQGRHCWLKGGQDLAVLGEILQQNKYYYDWVDYPIRYNALTKYFNVRGNKGFGERTFRKSTIEEVYVLKKGQFSFIRPIHK
jgi:hypothetical protein